jgi:hypothetical protein
MEHPVAPAPAQQGGDEGQPGPALILPTLGAFEFNRGGCRASVDCPAVNCNLVSGKVALSCKSTTEKIVWSFVIAAVLFSLGKLAWSYGSA